MKKISLLLLGFALPWLMAPTTVTKPTHITINPATGGGSSCLSTVGTLTGAAIVNRATGVAPLLVFFDSTNGATSTTNPGSSTTTLAANHTNFQDIFVNWVFGDTGPSGSGTWAVGSNPGANSRNAAIGGIAAHVFDVAPGSGDQTYNIAGTITDGVNTVNCPLSITAYDPVGPNGFPGTATTCYFNTAVGPGCPAGSAQVLSGAQHTPASGQQVLYKCGDSFAGGTSIASSTVKASIGAYGPCPGTPISIANHSQFPQLTGGGGNIITINSVNTGVGPIDVRIANLDLEGTVGGVGVATSTGFNVSQLLIYNVYTNGAAMGRGYYCSGCTQSGLVSSITNGANSGSLIITNYWNYGNNNCKNVSSAYACGTASPDLTLYNNTDYNAIIGNLLDNTGVPSTSTLEDLRVSSCRLCVISNNQFSRTSPANGGANLKFNSGNNLSSSGGWLGKWSELIEIDDNLVTGNTGGQAIELATENSDYDERERNLVFERNIVATSGTASPLATSGVNFTFRDNIFYGGLQSGSQGNLYATRRGIEGSSCSTKDCTGGTLTAAPVDPNIPYHYEIYNNTFWLGGTAISANGWYTDHPPSINVHLNNSFIQNNLFFSVTGTGTLGASNVINSNTTTTTNNPGFVAIGNILSLPYWLPTANFSGATNVPNFYDALGVPWTSGAYDLGALHH